MKQINLKFSLALTLFIALFFSACATKEQRAFKAFEKQEYDKTIEFAEEACEEDNYKMCYLLGIAYLETAEITPKEYNEMEKKFHSVGEKNSFVAKQYFEKACYQGSHTRACYRLGLMNKSNQKYKEALRLFKVNCYNGLAESCMEFGFMYYFGEGVEYDYVKAQELICRSCDMGYALACHHCGLGYYDAKEGVEQDLVKALMYNQKACEMGDPTGQGCYWTSILEEELRDKLLKRCKNEEEKATSKGCIEEITREEIYLEIPYKNGEIHGDLQEYYKNGTLKAKISYKNGEVQPFAEFYYENGEKQINISSDGVDYYDEQGRWILEIDLDARLVTHYHRDENLDKVFHLKAYYNKNDEILNLECKANFNATTYETPNKKEFEKLFKSKLDLENLNEKLKKICIEK